MLLGWKIDNPARSTQYLCLSDKHLPDLHLFCSTRSRIQMKICREPLLEHQREAFAHHPDGVDRIHQRLRARIQQVTFCHLNHAKYQPGRACTLTFKPLS
jgi:hypothetical protein